MSLEMQRERVKLLRASAAALIDETISEPCWGLAHSLLEMAEGLVRESGHPAEHFGSGGGTVCGPEDVEFMPECCAACGEWGGQHVGWCTHVEAQAAEGEPEFEVPEPAASSEQPLHHFGCCPQCHQEGRIVHIWRDQWCLCEDHMLAWRIGSNLFSGWRSLTQEQHEANRALIKRCERIEPPLCTCSSERSPAEDAAAGELLAWLDLSGLPPAPPEPPTRRLQNWRFDDPDNVDRIPF